MTNLSKCCNAPVTIEGGMPEDSDNGKTHYFVCGWCHKPCDLADVDSTKSQDLREKIAKLLFITTGHSIWDWDKTERKNDYLNNAKAILNYLDTPEGQAYLRSKGWVSLTEILIRETTARTEGFELGVKEQKEKMIKQGWIQLPDGSRLTCRPLNED